MVEVVLYGIGGVGKTQVALQYVDLHHQDYSSVFWLNAASEQALKLGFVHIMQRLIDHHAQLQLSEDREPDYTKIGRLLGMADKFNTGGRCSVQQEDEQHIINAVKRWFNNPENTRWLLLFDNLDDLESFDLNDYIPSGRHGTVIITSRRRESLQGRTGLEVLQMHDGEAERLLMRSANFRFEGLTPTDLKQEKEAMTAIAQKLGYLPLALDQAGAYIHIQEYSFGRYLKEYEKDSHVRYFLDGKWKVGKHNKSISATWELSFNAIQKQNPKSAELLLIFGFLDNNDISEELLQRGMKLPRDDSSLIESIRVLFSYSMAKRMERGDSFSIHPLVHMWARSRLDAEPEERRKKATEAFLIVSTAVVTSDHLVLQEWEFERRIMPHITAVEGHMKTVAMVDIGMLTGGQWLGHVYQKHGHYGKALAWYERVSAGREKVLGVAHPDTLATAHGMALVYLQQGQYDKMLEWYGRVLAGSEKSLGVDHPTTLATVNMMAMVYTRQGQYDKALQWYGRVLAGWEKSLGVDHPTTLAMVNMMAKVYTQQGQYDKALQWYGRVLAGREKSLGVDHPTILATVNMMAMVYTQQGQYDKALQWYGRVLAGREKALGVDHPTTLATVNMMAKVYTQQGQYDKALQWYGRALAGLEKKSYLFTPATVHGMAWVYSQQGQYDKALQMCGRVLAVNEKSLGVDHPITLATVNNMAMVYTRQGQYDKALQWYGRVLAGWEKSLGVDHPTTLATVHGMALVYSQQGQYDKALEWYGRVFAGSEKSLGMYYPNILDTLHGMALVYLQQGQYDKMLEWYGRVLAGSEKSLGVDHPTTLATVNMMAMVYTRQGQYDKALEWYGRVLAGWEKALGVDHPTTLDTVNIMAMVYTRQGQYDKALEWYGRVLAGREKALGVKHPDILAMVHHMAELLKLYQQVLAGTDRISKLHFNGGQSIHSITSMLVDLYERIGQREQGHSLQLLMSTMTQGLEVTSGEIPKKRAGCELGSVGLMSKQKKRE
ncbi:hypothetical protein BGX38DRAFT_570907 [Terfezia claveryi]|nr:hypothetical protein BGX38DRAFT_570907 [Terfezia claveryi]